MKLIRRDWNTWAAGQFARIDPLLWYDPAELAAEVEGGSVLYHVEIDGQERAALILQKERDRLWIVALAGEVGGSQLIAALADTITDLARFNGCRLVACRTKRKGLQKWLESSSFEVSPEVTLIRAC